MKDFMNNFMKYAQGLSKSPLGIFALFIILIYGLALMIPKPNTGQTWVFLVFLFIFAFLVLWSFVYLVCKYPHNLNQQKDFHSNKSVKPDVKQSSNGNPDENQNTNMPISYPSPTKLALQQLEIELKAKITQSETTYHGPNNTIIEFDSSFYQKNLIYGIIVKYIPDDKALSSIREFLLTISSKIKCLNNPDLMLIIAVVYEKNQKEIEDQLNTFINKINLKVNPYFYEYASLLKRFGVT